MYDRSQVNSINTLYVHIESFHTVGRPRSGKKRPPPQSRSGEIALDILKSTKLCLFVRLFEDQQLFYKELCEVNLEPLEAVLDRLQSINANCAA